MTMLSHNLGGNIPFEIERMDHRTMIDLPPGTELPSKKFRARAGAGRLQLARRALDRTRRRKSMARKRSCSVPTAPASAWNGRRRRSTTRASARADREAIRHNNAARAIAKVKRPMQVAAE